MFTKNIVLTEEQQEAVNKCIDFIKNGNHTEYFVLQGASGTGKTTIIRKVLSHFRNKQIIVGALSHKAKAVITQSVKQDNINCKSLTLASMLGMILDFETGKFKRDFNNKKPPLISLGDIVILDESSMLNEESLALIFQYKKYGAKILCLGDDQQLGPIREVNSDLPSPTFNTENKVYLTKKMRQVEDHPVIKYAQFYGDNSRCEFPVENPVPPELRVNKEQDANKLLFYNNISELYPLIESKFKEAINTNNPNLIKIVTYRNITRKSINKYFHEVLFANPETHEVKEFNVNEQIIFQDNYEVDSVTIDNSSEFQVKKVLSSKTTIDGKELKIFGLEIDVYDHSDDYVSVIIKVLAEESKDDYARHVSKLFTKAKSYLDRSPERKKALEAAWEAKNRYANIDYAYALTAYRIQGSTYNSIVVNESDIMQTAISSVTKSRAIYTALTRAKYEVYVI